MSLPSQTPVAFLQAADARGRSDGPCVAVIRTRKEFLEVLPDACPSVQWLQMEGLLSDQEVWAAAAQGTSALPLDVILTDPAAEFSALYRLVDVRLVRPVRVTMPVLPGFMKALRLASAIQLPVRLLPGQPHGAALEELQEAALFYLHDEAVDAPVEPFHSLLAALRGGPGETLWQILEADPALYDRSALPAATSPGNFIPAPPAGFPARDSECFACEWQDGCAGFFKSPDPSYRCDGIKKLLASLAAAAAEFEDDLAAAALATV